MNSKQGNIYSLQLPLPIKQPDTNLLAAINAGTDVRSYVVKITATGKCELPAAAGDIALFAVEDVMTSIAGGFDVTLRPISDTSQCRLIATGTGNAGTQLIHDTAAYGKVKGYTIGSAIFVLGIAEEDWTAGQYVLVRKYNAVTP